LGLRAARVIGCQAANQGHGHGQHPPPARSPGGSHVLKSTLPLGRMPGPAVGRPRQNAGPGAAASVPGRPGPAAGRARSFGGAAPRAADSRGWPGRQRNAWWPLLSPVQHTRWLFGLPRHLPLPYNAQRDKPDAERGSDGCAG
jgi:hypothetical protein